MVVHKGIFSLHVIASLVHIVGLYFLITVKRRRLTATNITTTTGMILYSNFILLTLLSASELVFSASNVSLRTIGHFIGTKHTEPVRFHFDSITMGLNCSLVYVITLNRLLATLYPFWYLNWMTKKKFVRAALGVTLAIATVFIAGRNMTGSYDPGKTEVRQKRID